MNDKQFDYILAISQEKTLSAAAKRLGISQPTLSNFLIALEDKLGTELFYHEKKQMYPTPAGEIYLHAADKIKTIHARTALAIRQLQNEDRSILRIAASPLRGAIMFASLFPTFSRRYPTIQLRMKEVTGENIFNEVRSGGVDLGLSAFLDTAHNDFHCIPTSVEELILAVPDYYDLQSKSAPAKQALPVSSIGNTTEEPPYPIASLPVLDIAELHDAPFVLYGSGTCVRAISNTLFLTNGIYPPVVYESMNGLVIQRMVQEGAGCALIPSSQMNPDFKHVSYYRLRQRYLLNLGMILSKTTILSEPLRYFIYLMRMHDAQNPHYLAPEKNDDLDAILQEFKEEA
ncbi:MAG: LysR family transcriptional regulator [Oribacterium sp.]|nr:LysR family transcriptional regulator [Oribacterium sp.]